VLAFGDCVLSNFTCLWKSMGAASMNLRSKSQKIWALPLQWSNHKVACDLQVLLIH
jgi:hypothetical protein